MSRTTHTLLGIVVACAIPATVALALGRGLSESKEELNLKYDVLVSEGDAERMTVTFELEDEGRLKPISSIDLHVPGSDTQDGGGATSDLEISMATRREGTKQVSRVHLRKDWAARAEIRITTSNLDGKQGSRTWYYHAIPLKDLVDEANPPKPGN